MAIAVKLYAGTSLSGDEVDIEFGHDRAHLSDLAFNDRTSSLKVMPGYYAELYEDADYDGSKRAFEAGTVNSMPSGWDNLASSVKTFFRCAAIVYKDSSYGGSSMIIDQDVSSFKNIGFNDAVTAVKVMSGCKVTFYKDSNYQGDSRTFTSSCPNVGDEWNDKISSVRVEYLYGAMIYSGSDFNGGNSRLEAGNYDTASLFDGSGVQSLKVNDGYTAKVFYASNWEGEPTLHVGPCAVQSTGAPIRSLQLIKDDAAVVAWSSSNCQGSSLVITKSIYDMNSVDWDDNIYSLRVNPGYLVQVCWDEAYRGERMFLQAVDGVVNFTGDLSDWANEISSIRLFRTDKPAVYLFEDGNFGGEGVQLTTLGESTSESWRWSSDDGHQHSIGNDELSSVLIVGDLKVTLYQNTDKSGDSLVLYGPGFFDLCAFAKEHVKRKTVFNDKTSKIKIEAYTPHPAASSRVRGYAGLTLLRGDLHNHTLWSDAYWGGDTASDIIEYIDNPKQTFRIYQALGYDFDGISDHVFGADSDGNPRYAEGMPRSIPFVFDPVFPPKYAVSPDQWEKTKQEANRTEHNYNFSSLAGYEYSLGGAKIDSATNDPPDTSAHYNVFGTSTIYYGQPSGWENTPETRRNFYRWASEEFARNQRLVVQFNHPGDGGAGFNGFEMSEAEGCNIEVFALVEVYSASGKDGSDKDFFEGYVNALKQGWRVAPTATSDNHDGIEELQDFYDKIRTVVAAPRSSKDAVLEALVQRRVYATRVPGLRVAYSLTNRDGETAILGGQIDARLSTLRLDFEVSGEGLGSVSSIELLTPTEQIQVWSGSAPTSLLLVDHAVTLQTGTPWVYAVVKTTDHPEHALITAPIWVDNA